MVGGSDREVYVSRELIEGYFLADGRSGTMAVAKYRLSNAIFSHWTPTIAIIEDLAQ